MKIREQEQEMWKPIPEYEEHYLISNFGRIKSIKFSKEKILTGKVTNDYIELDLRKPNHLVKTVRVHKIVAELFLDNPHEYPIVNHKDGDKHNNHVNNLEWCDYSHNNSEAYRLGLNKTKPILQKDLDGNIIKRWNSIKEASDELNIGGSNISKCAKGNAKTCGGYKWDYSYRGFEEVPINYRKNKEEPIMPVRGTSKSAGYDFATPVDIEIKPHSKALIWTDICSYMEDDEVLMLHIRSSVGIKQGLMLANITGVIDSDYYQNKDNYGNIGICIFNPTDTIKTFKRGDRIAQGIFSKYLVADNGNTNGDRLGGIGSTN